MNNLNELLIPIIFVALAPVLGGLLYGFERKVKARMQNRVGPKLLQPFYDFFKLLDKRTLMIHSTHAFLGVAHFVAMWFALGVLVFGGDLLVVIFLHLLATGLLILGGFSVRSVFSHMGSLRQALSALSYEPVLIVVAVCFFVVTGSFEAKAVFAAGSPLILKMPLAFIALAMVLPIKLKKSPFDVADAHQEIVGGAEIEYSGIFFEALYTSRWLEYVFGYTFVYMFGGGNVLVGLGLVAIVFFAVNAVDNSTGRLTFRDMVRLSLGVSLPVALVNLLFVVM